jgi:methylenetetrahydrofolate dehydrogenase (NADP+)/methenyltetrahydrofolate cyclohydrolase
LTRLLDGRTVAAVIRGEVAAGVGELAARAGRPPGLVVVAIGDDPASRVYVASKERAAREAGIRGRVRELPADVSADEVLALLDDLNRDAAVDGVLVQLPLPPALPEAAILGRVDPAKDVDGFHPLNVGRLWRDEPGPVPATPRGILELLRRSGIPLAGRPAVIVGRSDIVGKPLAALLLREDCTVTVCHSRTRDLAAVCRGAEILVAAVGHPGLIGPEHVGAGAVVVDVGVNRVADRTSVERLFPGEPGLLRQLAERGSILVGDVDFARVAPRAGAITPVPGGVGPMTVAALLANTLDAARRRLFPGDSPPG